MGLAAATATASVVVFVAAWMIIAEHGPVCTDEQLGVTY